MVIVGKEGVEELVKRATLHCARMNWKRNERLIRREKGDEKKAAVSLRNQEGGLSNQVAVWCKWSSR